VFAAWLFTNQQVFRNVIEVNTGDNLFADAGHNLGCFTNELLPGTIFAILLFFQLLFYLLKFGWECV